MKKFLLYSVLACVFIIQSCKDSNENSSPLKEGKKSFTLKGTLKNFKGKQLILQGLNYEAQKWESVDTAEVSEGSYEFAVNNVEPDFFVIVFNDTLTQSVLADNAEMEFNADMNDFEKTREFKYTKANTQLIEFSKRIEPNTNKMKQLGKDAQTLMTQGKMDSIAFYQKAFDAERLKVKQVAKTYIHEIMPSMAVFALIDNFGFEDDYGFLDSLITRMKTEMKDSKYTKVIAAQFDKNKAMKEAQTSGAAVGNVAPDFELKDPNGKAIKLSAFRGKYLLLDFWASWCRPCRAENPNVVKLYQKYKGADFDILSVSLDDSKVAWLKAIETDGLTWTHVSDLGGWDSAVVPLYGIQGIPATYLLDKEGKIIAVNLRGEELAQKLEEVLE